LIWTTERKQNNMKIIAFLILAAVLFALFYVLSLRGRTGHTDFKSFKGHYFAHRGLHNNSTAPENSMAAFRRAKEKGYGVEFDVHLMADGNLAVIHDSSLLRTAGVGVKIEELKTEDLNDYFLEGTAENIPTFSEVLSFFDGKVPLIIEIKTVGKNFAKLTKTVCEQLKNYNGAYCLESFDPRVIYWLKKNEPDIIRGQLSENYFKNDKSTLPLPLKLLMTGLSTNCLTKPDFVAYRFADRNHISYKLCRKIWKVQGVGWTITKDSDLKNATEENILPIFEKITP